MANKVYVDLSFGADTSKAKKEIADLQKSLQNIATMPGKTTSLFDDTEIKNASKAALELQTHLQNAVNVNTGKLDLSKLSMSLKAGGKDLTTYYNQLVKLGPAGQDAFFKIAQAVVTADAPVMQINKRLQEMGTTLKNTAKWQISSSLLHGFMGTLQSAFGYAQDLNESLTDIRIVTNASVDEMADFAKEANKAAKALSTTTTAYTQASLIYYQQGLSAEEVKERTDITIKMANATRESAQTVSDQLTSVWNNFYEEGGQSLEHYADAMAKLGADTASSTDEIAGGLEKFAAVGNMIGLSFDNAAAALATITATTRQSEDIVGTALRTIFARIQGLNLGETLDDGTTLNKYSAALEKVGINIFDQAGQLKDMDTILDEMGSKWQTISKDQQIALAQTVAGTRQYSQLVALMDNFDFYQKNVESAKNSDGALQAQADIYAQSWEAAQERVQAAAENIYDSLINDDFFVDLLDGLENVLETVGGLIDGFGGLSGILTTVGSIFMTYYAKSMPKALENLKTNLRVFTGQSLQVMQEQQEETAAFMATGAGTFAGKDYEIQSQAIQDLAKMQKSLIENSKYMTADEIEQYKLRMKNVEAIYENAKALAKESEEMDKQAKKSKNAFAKNMTSNIVNTFGNYTKSKDNAKYAEEKRNEAIESDDISSGEASEMWSKKFVEATAEADKFKEKTEEIAKVLMDLQNNYDLEVFDENTQFYDFSAMGESGSLSIEDQTALKQVVEQTTNAYKEQVTKRKELDVLGQGVRSQASDWKKQADTIGKSQKATKELEKNMKSYAKIIKDAMDVKGIKNQEESFNDLAKDIANANGDVNKLVAAFDKFASSKAIQAIDTEIDSLDKSIEAVEGGMSKLGVDTQGLQQMKDDIEGAAEATAKLNIAQENAQGASNDPAEGAYKWSEALTQVGATALSTYAAVQTVTSSLAVFGDDSATTLEKIGAGIALVTTAGSLWNTVMQLSTVLMKNESAQKAVSAVMTKIFTAAKGAETAAVIMNSAAWYANPIMWIAVVIAAVIAAIVALIAVIMKNNQALEESNKQSLEQAEQMQENIDKTQELSASVDELTNSYEELSKAGEDTTEVLAKMDDEIPALIKSYQDLGNSLGGELGDKITTLAGQLEHLYKLGKMTGDFEEFLNTKEELDTAVLEGERDNAISGSASAAYLMANSMNKKGKGNSYDQNSGKLTLHVGGVNTYSGKRGELSEEDQAEVERLQNEYKALNKQLKQEGLTDDQKTTINQQLKERADSFRERFNFSIDGDDNEEKIANDILQDVMGSYWEDASGWAGSGAKLSVNTQDPNEFVDYYQKLQQARLQMVNEMDDETRAHSNIFKEIDDALQAGAEQYEKLLPFAETAVKNSGDLTKAKVIEANANYKSIDSMQEYIDYQKAYIEQAKLEKGITEEQAKKYLEQEKIVGRVGNQYALAEQIVARYGTTLDNLSDGEREGLLKSMEDLTAGLTDDQIQLAIGVMATTDSLAEFQEQMRHVEVEAAQQATTTMMGAVSDIMQASIKENEFSASDLESLKTNEDFTEYLDSTGQTFGSFNAANYDEQYTIVTDFYHFLEEKQLDSIALNKALYAEDVVNYEEALNKIRKLSEEDKAEMEKLQNDYIAEQKKLDNEDLTDKQRAKIYEALKAKEDAFQAKFGFSIELSEDGVTSKLEEISNKIKDMNNQEIKIAMSWDGVEKVENSYETVSKFAKVMRKDAEKVGDSYQLTAAQAREWMEVYPDLFKEAKRSTNGIVSLDVATVENYLKGQDERVDGNADAEIKILQTRRTGLEAQLALVEADLKLAQANAVGKENLEKASVEYLTDSRASLIKYYMDAGMDEVNANKAALETMGLNEEEYSALVADAAKRNAENTTKSATEGGEAQAGVLSKLNEKWINFSSNLGKIGNNILDVLKGNSITNWILTKIAPGLMSGDSSTDTGDGTKNTYEGSLSGRTFDSLGEQELTAARQEVNSKLTKALDESKEQIEKAIASVDTQIAYLEDLKAQDISDYGSDDLDDVRGGKGDGKASKKDIEDATEAKDRYHEITREIAAQERLLNQLSKIKDRVYGKDKLKVMEEEAKRLEILYDRENKLLALQKVFLGLDKLEVQNTFAEATFDEYGNISNYTDIYLALVKKVNDAKDKFNASQSDADKAALQEIERDFEKKMEILEQYEETLDALNTQQDKLTDIKNQIEDNAYEQLTYKIEMKIEVNDRELQQLDYYLSKMEDDFYSMAEAAKLMLNKGSQYTDSLSIYNNEFEDLNTLYKEGKISQDQYIEGLKQSYDGVIDNLTSLRELDDEMMHYYGTTLDAAGTEMDKYTSKMEHLSSVLDHYRSVVELVNGEYDYKAIGTILEGQAETRENEMKVAVSNYEMLLGEKEAIEAQMASVEEGSAAWELYKQQLDDIELKTQEAEDNMLSKTEAWAEAMKSVMENTFASAAREMEMAMTEGMGFDALNNSLDRLSSFQEVYLTNTNEIYELEKMMRTAQQAADKTNNEAAKQKLKNYQNEIDTLKNDGLPLSQLELDIQKAKYDLLLAEIALEEAQNAKSTVRLQRDAEGNYGYVYTADTEAITSAEQDLADAQNALYNIGLEGTNDYGQKLLELQNQLSEDLIALEEERAAGRYATEAEYEAAKAQLISEYNQLFTAYSNQYTTALGVDNKIQEEAWINAYDSMIAKTSDWKDYTTQYTEECEEAYEEWREEVAEHNEVVQDVLEKTRRKVKEVTDESDDLRKLITRKVIPDIEDQLVAVRNMTKGWANQRDMIGEVINQYEILTERILEALAAQAMFDGEDSNGNVSDYSIAMAEYLAEGGKYGSREWNRLVAGRKNKLEEDDYAQYAEGADEFDELMKKYYDYKQNGVSNELTEYVEDVLARGDYWNQNRVEELIESFATGGYTGAWGPDGRLAVVHEKELMLNPDDTINFLNGISILREIANIIDLEAMRSQFSLMPYLPIANTSGAPGLMEQMVQIEAHFPNATDRNEIQEAFNNLLNTASQYANRK